MVYAPEGIVLNRGADDDEGELLAVLVSLGHLRSSEEALLLGPDAACLQGQKLLESLALSDASTESLSTRPSCLSENAETCSNDTRAQDRPTKVRALEQLPHACIQAGATATTAPRKTEQRCGVHPSLPARS